MKAVILAAGIGSRLRPITNEKPKTLVQVNGKPMLGYILDALLQNNIKDVVVCVGFMADLVINYCETNFPQLSFTFVNNTNYETTNNMYSLFLSRQHLDEDIILMNADLVFDSAIIKGLIRQKTTSVAVDKGKYLEESMKIVVENKKIVAISKTISKQQSYGSSIDIYFLKKEDVTELKKEMEKIILEDKQVNQWTEVLLDRLFQASTINAYPFPIEDAKWYEIDNYDDLAIAEKIFNTQLGSIKKKKIFFIDRDGTLTLGKTKLHGASDFLKSLKNKKKIFYILTNNSSRTPLQHKDALQNADIHLEEKNILLSTDAALVYLKEHKYKEVFWIANSTVDIYIKKEGFTFNEKDPQALLLTYDTQITYDKLSAFCRLVRTGLPYYATHLDVVCPTENGDIPDIGTFIQVIFMTTGKKPNKTFGKPNTSIVDVVLKKHKLTYKDAVVIGDRLYTDIKLVENNDITSILVLSGETKREDYENSKIRADIVVNDISEIISYL